MQAISGQLPQYPIPGEGSTPNATAGIKPAAAARPPVKEGERPLPAHGCDEYLPGEKPGPSGRYWPVRDGKGKLQVYFDGPSRPDAPVAAAQGPDSAPAEAEPAEGRPADRPKEARPEKAGSPRPPEKEKAADGPESCTTDTSRVDREIEKLKKEKEELERQLQSETNEKKAHTLQEKLAQLENELRQKDSDAYRRQHAAYTRS